MLYSRGFPQGLPHPSFAHPRRELRRPPQQRRLSDGPSRKWSRLTHFSEALGEASRPGGQRVRKKACVAPGSRGSTRRQVAHKCPKTHFAESGRNRQRAVPNTAPISNHGTSIGIGAHLLSAQSCCHQTQRGRARLRAEHWPHPGSCPAGSPGCHDLCKTEPALSSGARFRVRAAYELTT